MENEATSKSIDDLCSKAFPVVAQGIRSGSSLPSAGDSFDFFQSYPAFSKFQRECNEKIISIIQSLSSGHGRIVREEATPDDLVENILEANDHILELVGNKLDEAAGITKNEKPILPSGRQAETMVVSSWNRQSDKTRMNRNKATGAEQIQKPQLMFRERPDNTAVPFVPRLFEKPNSIVSLPPQIVSINRKRHETGESLPSIMRSLGTTIDLQIYHHPYEQEIRDCGVAEIFVKPEKPMAELKFPPLDETPLTMVNTVLSLDLMISELAKSRELAFDLEHHAYRSYLGFTCLMQISTRTHDYIVDTLSLREELWKLNKVTTNAKIVKIFHGGQADILWLQKDFGVYIVNMFDTFYASQKLCLPKHSYDYLLQHYCKIRVDKRYQLADWRIRPLPAEMLKYAREDTHYLPYIFDRMRIDLERKAMGNVREVFRRSREVALLRYEKPIFTEESFLKVYKKKNRKEFNSQQLEAFRLLYAWRDQMARNEDECTDYVIPNHIMLQIAEILPREQQGILACFTYNPVLVKQNLHAIHKLIRRAREIPVEKQPEKIEMEKLQIQNVENFETENIHDWSKESNTDTPEFVPVKVAVRKSSNISTSLSRDSDTTGSQSNIRVQIEENFRDPFCPRTIPYELYLSNNKPVIDIVNQEETIIQKIWKVKQADPAPKQVPETLPVHTSSEEKEEENEMSVNEMKGKRKSTGSIPAPKKQRLDHVVRPAHKFTQKDYKIFGTTKLADKSSENKNKQKHKRNKSAPGAPAPSYFTEPNFGKVKQTSKMVRHGKTDSFTYKKE